MGKELITVINKSSVSTLERGKNERNQKENTGNFLRKGGI